MSNSSTVDYYIAPRKSFEATADAIRAMNGSTAQMTWGQNGFADAVGGERRYTLDQMNDINFPAASGDIVMEGTVLRPSLFYGNKNIISFTGNNITNAKGDNFETGQYSRAFQGCTNLVSVSMPKLNDLYHVDNLFYNCTKLESVVLDWYNMKRLGTGVFYKCESLNKEIYVLPNLITKIYSNVITNNPFVTTFDICVTTNTASEKTINTSAFPNNSSFNTLIIRNTGYILTLGNISAFTGTPFASDGAGGTLYVPQSLMSSYESATNWITILSYENNQIKSIEGSYYETHYADGTEIPTT